MYVQPTIIIIALKIKVTGIKHICLEFIKYKIVHYAGSSTQTKNKQNTKKLYSNINGKKRLSTLN